MGWQHYPNGVGWNMGGREEDHGIEQVSDGIRMEMDGSSRIEYGRRTHAGRSLLRGYITCLGLGGLCGRPLVCHCTPPAAFELPPGNTGFYYRQFKLYHRK